MQGPAVMSVLLVSMGLMEALQVQSSSAVPLPQLLASELCWMLPLGMAESEGTALEPSLRASTAGSSPSPSTPSVLGAFHLSQLSGGGELDNRAPVLLGPNLSILAAPSHRLRATPSYNETSSLKKCP